jgi:hypothetical protein
LVWVSELISKSNLNLDSLWIIREVLGIYYNLNFSCFLCKLSNILFLIILIQIIFFALVSSIARWVDKNHQSIKLRRSLIEIRMIYILPRFDTIRICTSLQKNFYLSVKPISTCKLKWSSYLYYFILLCLINWTQSFPLTFSQYAQSLIYIYVIKFLKE